MAKINLTTKTVEKLRKQPGRYRDEQVKGLLLVVTGPNSAAWTLRYEHNGRERWAGIGSVRDVPLSIARERARAMRLQLVVDRIDPLAARQAEKAARKAADLKAMTFKQCADAYLEQHSSKWREGRELGQWQGSLRDYVYPVIGDLPVGAVDTPLVLKVLEQKVEATSRYPAGTLWTARRETATRVRGRIEAILGWATVRGYRTGDNPARWSGHLREVLPGAPATQEHFSAMPWAEVPGFVATLRTTTGVAARALEFIVLTAARSAEALGAQWSEINLDEGVWTIPASRMKAGREHRVPLAPAAIALLRSLYVEQDNPNVFTLGGGGALSPRALRRLHEQLSPNATLHGMRSAFRDWCGERTNFPREVAEAALAHRVGDAVEQAYRRGDALEKRRRLMTAWADYLASPGKASADVVVPIKQIKAN